MAAQGMGPVVSSVRLFGEFDYAAKSWPQAHRVVLKAEVLAGNTGRPAKDNQRYVVTSLRSPTPPRTLPAGVLPARTSGELDQTSEGRFEVRPHLGFKLPR
jgi:hypothetical protein